MSPAGKCGIVCVGGRGQRVCFRPGLCGTWGYRVGVGVNSQSDSHLAAQGPPSSGQAGYRPPPSPTPHFLCADRKILEHPSPLSLGSCGEADAPSWPLSVPRATSFCGSGLCPSLVALVCVSRRCGLRKIQAPTRCPPALHADTHMS